jgi:hypothetical protein
VTSKGERDARRALLRSFQRTPSCFSWAVVTGGSSGEGEPEYIEIPQRFVPLSGRHQLEFWLRHSYELRQQDGMRTALTTEYSFQLRERTGPEIIAFHWHPNQENQLRFPHLHIRSRTGSVDISRRRHVPTGVVSLSSVVRFALVEHGVRPLRADWEQVLNVGEQHFACQHGR